MPIDVKKAEMGTVVKDFYKSDAPQFKGKSKKKRREMAIAAKLSAEDTTEILDANGNLFVTLIDIVKAKPLKEEDDYKSRNKELKKTKPAMKHRFKTLHKGGDDDVNEGKCDDCNCKGCGQNPCIECGEDHHKLGKKVDEGVVARAVRDTIDKLPQGLPGGKRARIRDAAVRAEISDKKSKEKRLTYRQWSDKVNAKINKSKERAAA